MKTHGGTAHYKLQFTSAQPMTDSSTETTTLELRSSDSHQTPIQKGIHKPNSTSDFFLYPTSEHEYSFYLQNAFMTSKTNMIARDGE